MVKTRTNFHLHLVVSPTEMRGKGYEDLIVNQLWDLRGKGNKEKKK
jgi:hypothetical protein